MKATKLVSAWNCLYSTRPVVSAQQWCDMRMNLSKILTILLSGLQTNGSVASLKSWVSHARERAMGLSVCNPWTESFAIRTKSQVKIAMRTDGAGRERGLLHSSITIRQHQFDQRYVIWKPKSILFCLKYTFPEKHKDKPKYFYNGHYARSHTQAHDPSNIWDEAKPVQMSWFSSNM